MAGTAIARSHAASSTGQAVGSSSRPTIAIPSAPARSIAMATTGASMRRVSGVLPRICRYRRRTTPAHHAEHEHGTERAHDGVHERGLALQHEQRVRGAVANAARVRAGNAEVVGDDELEPVEHGDHGRHRAREEPVDAIGQPARREGQHEVDDQELDHPTGGPADGVGQGGVRLGERRHRPAGAGRDEHQPEAAVRTDVPRVGADRHRHGHHQRACERAQAGLALRPGVCEQRRAHGRRHAGHREADQRDHGAARGPPQPARGPGRRCPWPPP